MNISDKITEIRLQPEHVRMRYVWGSVAFCMVIIFAIWIFSISVMFKEQKNSGGQEKAGNSDLAKQLQELKQQTPSLQNYADQPLTIQNEGVTTPKQDTSEFQYPAQKNNSEVPQASGYSELPATTTQ